MNAYILSVAAKNDLKDIRDYLWDQAGRNVAAKVLNEIPVAIIRLTQNPGLGHRRIDLADDFTRFYLVYRYLIVYRSRGETIEIGRVLHSARDLKKILED